MQKNKIGKNVGKGGKVGMYSIFAVPVAFKLSPIIGVPVELLAPAIAGIIAGVSDWIKYKGWARENTPDR